MDDRALMRLHLNALFTHDSHGRMLRVNEPNGARAPRFFLGRTTSGCEWRVRDDVADPTLLSEIERTVIDEPRGESALEPIRTPYASLFVRHGAIERSASGPAFVCPLSVTADARAVRVTHDNAHVLERYLSAWMGDVETAKPLFVMQVDGEAVAVCASVRITPDAHEAGVETVAACRGRGFAPAVVSAWATAVRGIGAVPLYSTSWSNAASRAVARKLRLQLFGSDFHIT